jgi:hypothetical protein
VFGPLPRIYRVLVIAGAFLLSVAGGVWLAHSLGLARGVLVGAAFGGLLGFALVHDFSQGQRARPLRVIRRR